MFTYKNYGEAFPRDFSRVMKNKLSSSLFNPLEESKRSLDLLGVCKLN